jgi:hypothetical protein
VEKYLSILTSLILFLPLVISAEIQEGDWALEKISPPVQKGPFSVSANYDAMGNAKFDHNHFKRDKIRYAQGNITGSFIPYYDEAHQEGMLIGLGYTNVHMVWNNNPYFNQHTSQTVNLTLGGFSERLCDWDWKGTAVANINTHYFNCDYVNYDFTLWGRYSYTEDIGLHCGFTVQTGMKMDRVYPIIGIDWTINQDWKLDLVFPIDMTLSYHLTKDWSLAIATRFFSYRNRVNKNEPLSMAVFRYQSTGAELAIEYDNDENIKGSLHGGMILGGHIRVANRQNEHPRRLKFKSAPYGGAAIAFRF